MTFGRKHSPSGPADFVSDTSSGAHPEAVAALLEANVGHALPYGGDPVTARAEEAFREHFGPDICAFPVFNGTGANISALATLVGPHGAAYCSDVAHLYLDECGAAERLAGTRLLPLPTEHGKLTPDDLARWESRRGKGHRTKPEVVSITQCTEAGTVYSAAETRAIADAAHALGMHVHLDGARLANAAAALGESLRALTTDAGVDVFSLGGVKNGLMFGEALVFCRSEMAESFEQTRLQFGQLPSKMRFVAAQLTALLTDDLWLRNARHANAMARRLASAVAQLDGLTIEHPVETNAVFARLRPDATARLLSLWPVEMPAQAWESRAGALRWMCAWDTAPEDVDAFAAAVAEAVSS